MMNVKKAINFWWASPVKALIDCTHVVNLTEYCSPHLNTTALACG
jgi:hypothetical protein